MFDTLAFGMGFLELLRGTFEVSPHVLQLCRHLLLQRQLLHVNSVVGVGCDGRVGVLLPCKRFGSADDDFDAVILDSTGESAWQSSFSDKCLDGFFYLWTECVDSCFGFVTCYLRSEKLVNYFKICCHDCESFVLGLVCEWPLIARADSHSTLAVNNVVIYLGICRCFLCYILLALAHPSLPFREGSGVGSHSLETLETLETLRTLA